MRDYILKKIANAIIRRPWLILAAAFFITALCIYYSATHLELHTDQDDLVSEELEYHRRYKDFLREFGDLEYLYVVTEVEGNLPHAKEFTKKVAGKIASLPGISEVTYKIDNPVLEKSFLLYLSEERLKQLASFLSKGASSASNISRWNDISSVISTMNQIIAGPGIESRKEELKSGFGFLSELVNGIDKTLRTGHAYSPNLAGAFLGGEQTFDEEGYLLTPNGKLLFVLIMPEKRYDTLSVIEEPLKKIRLIIAETKAEFPDIKAGLTGRPVLQADEMSITNSDMTKATILSIVAVTILFVLYFRRLTRPVMAITALIFGIAWTLGLTTLVIGYLNLLSTVFAVILVGAGIEFGLQIVSRYREELDKHRNPALAVEVALTKTAYGNITAALTTAAAFYTALFTGFRALSELGFIAGSGILLCLASLMIVLPAMMYLHDRGKAKDKLKTDILVGLKGIEHLYDRPKLVIILLAALTIAGLPGLLRLGFDHNLLNLQAEGLESVEYEKLIIEKSDESTWYAISITKTPSEALKVAREMEKKSSVGKVETFETIVPPGQDEKIKLVGELKEAFGGVSYPEISKTIKKADVLYNLKVMSTNLDRLTEMAFSSGYTEAVEELDGLNRKILGAYSALQKASSKQLEPLEEFQGLFITKFRDGIKLLSGGLQPVPIKISDFPKGIGGKFISKNGNYATYVYPKGNIWEPDRMAEFITDIRSVDPSVAGTPVEVFESSRLMQNSFQKAAIYALFAIMLLVFIDFRSPRYTVLSLAGLSAGILWLLELMGWTGIPFNLANFFAIPVLLGVGVDNGVQIVHRYIQEGGSVKVMSTSTGSAVLLTSLTTGISFGMLLLSSHRGIQSLGMIMVLGTTTCLVGSMLLLPSILKLISARH